MKNKAVLSLLAVIAFAGPLASTPASAQCAMNPMQQAMNPMQRADLAHQFKKRERAYEKWLQRQYNINVSALPGVRGYNQLPVNPYDSSLYNPYGYSQLPVNQLGNGLYNNPYGYYPNLTSRLRSLLGL